MLFSSDKKRDLRSTYIWVDPNKLYNYMVVITH